MKGGMGLPDMPWCRATYLHVRPAHLEVHLANGKCLTVNRAELPYMAGDSDEDWGHVQIIGGGYFLQWPESGVGLDLEWYIVASKK